MTEGSSTSFSVSPNKNALFNAPVTKGNGSFNALDLPTVPFTLASNATVDLTDFNGASNRPFPSAPPSTNYQSPIMSNALASTSNTSINRGGFIPTSSSGGSSEVHVKDAIELLSFAIASLKV